jgi:uncharacterized protein YggT (Ycf19 family)
MISLIHLISWVLIIILVTRWVVSGILTQYENTGWYLQIKDATEPLLAGIRKLVPSFAGFDFSYIIAIVAIRLAAKVLIWIFL